MMRTHHERVVWHKLVYLYRPHRCLDWPVLFFFFFLEFAFLLFFYLLRKFLFSPIAFLQQLTHLSSQILAYTCVIPSEIRFSFSFLNYLALLSSTATCLSTSSASGGPQSNHNMSDSHEFAHLEEGIRIKPSTSVRLYFFPASRALSTAIYCPSPLYLQTL